MTANGNIVTIRNLSKVYQQGDINVTALDNISLDIAAEEFLALMGPSGSGKSTLLHIIAGIDRPTSGECQVQGIDVAQLNESQLADWRNQNVGFVFQTFNLIPVLTAFENVELPLLLTRLNRSERRRQVETALELVGLADRAKMIGRIRSTICASASVVPVSTRTWPKAGRNFANGSNNWKRPSS